MCHIFCRNPLSLTDFYGPPLCGIFWGHIFANMGDGGGQNHFQKKRPSIKKAAVFCETCSKIRTLQVGNAAIFLRLQFLWGAKVVIFFSLTEAPFPDLTPTPPNTPKRTRNTRNRPETDPKQTRNGPKRTRNGPKSSSLECDGRGVCRDGGGGFAKEKKMITMLRCQVAG